MAKSFIDVVQDSPRTGFGFKLHGWLAPLKSRTTLPSSVRLELSTAARPCKPNGKVVDR